MADPGVIALDPARLSGLSVYLQGLGDGCRQRAGRVADEVEGSGVDAEHPIGELERLAVLCGRERDEVEWRRALVEALPDDLPLPARTYPTASAAAAAGEALAEDVAAALDTHPPRWSRLVLLLAELDRSAGSGPFTVAFFTELGPRTTEQLPILLERAWRSAWTPPLGPDGKPTADEPTSAEALEFTAVEVRLAAAIRTASRVEGEAGLDPSWSRVYAGLPVDTAVIDAAEEAATPARRREVEQLERSLRAAGYGTKLAASVAARVGWLGAAAVFTSQSGLLQIATSAAALDDGDGLECDLPQAGLGMAAGALLLLAPVSAPAVAVAGVLGVASTVFSACRSQESRTRESTPVYDPDAGEPRMPSGHASNPHVDAAGVPLSPSYG